MVIGIDASRAFENQPTGTERYAGEMVELMVEENKKRGNQIILCVRPDTLVPVNIAGADYVKVCRIPLRYLWTQVGLAARTWIDRLDVLWVPAHTLPVLGKWRVPMVVTIHGIEYEWLPAYESKLQRWYLPWSTIFAVKRANKVVAVSEFTKEQLVARLGADRRKIVVISEGYRSGVGVGQRLAGILKKYGLEKKRYLLFVGTVQPRKNLARLIKAFGEEKSVPKGIKLVIAGKLGWLFDDVLEEISISPRRKDIIITGYVTDLDREVLLAGSLAYVQPSITEGFGLPILEAMSRGVPVISSKGGALSEVGGEAAIYFDPWSVPEMAEKIQLVLSSSRLRSVLAKRGIEQAKKYQWRQAANTMLNLLTYSI